MDSREISQSHHFVFKGIALLVKVTATSFNTTIMFNKLVSRYKICLSWIFISIYHIISNILIIDNTKIKKNVSNFIIIKLGFSFHAHCRIRTRIFY